MKEAEGYLLVSFRTSLSFSLMVEVPVMMTSVEKVKLAGDPFPDTSPAGATSWSGTETPGGLGPSACLSELSSSASNDDCRWSFSSNRQEDQRERERDA